MVSEADIITAVAGIGTGAILFTVGSRIRDTVGKTLYETLIFIAIITALYGSSAVFRLMNTALGDFWLFQMGEYGSLVLIFIMIIVKLMRWE